MSERYLQRSTHSAMLLSLSALLAIGCSSYRDPDAVVDEPAPSEVLVESNAVEPELEFVAPQAASLQPSVSVQLDAMAAQLLENMRSPSRLPGIAVVSVVELQNMQSSTVLGMQIAEQMAHRLQAAGYKIIDYKARDTIQVTSSGDFVLSRDFEKLRDSLPIEWALLGTMIPQRDGVQINLRLVDLRSKVVQSSAEGMLSNVSLEPTRGVPVRDGVKLLEQ